MADQVTAEVILRKRDGTSILDAEEPITAETIDVYRIEQEVIDEATRILEGLGFDVPQVGVTGLTIVGDKDTFEAIFQTTLVPRHTDVLSSKGATAEHVYYDATSPLVIPDTLSDHVRAIVLSSPPEYTL